MTIAEYRKKNYLNDNVTDAEILLTLHKALTYNLAEMVQTLVQMDDIQIEENLNSLSELNNKLVDTNELIDK